MFGVLNRVEEAVVSPAPVDGAAELALCVFDEKRRLLHHSSGMDASDRNLFKFLNVPEDAFEMHVPTSVVLLCGAGERKYLDVLPYENHRGAWRFVCLQTSLNSAPAGVFCDNSVPEERVCLVVVDKRQIIRSVGTRVPESFRSFSGSLAGMPLADLFTAENMRAIDESAADTNELIQNCVFHCPDGSRRDVEVRKMTVPEGFMLYGIYDVSPLQLSEDPGEVGTRERRRIGLELHDSIGQLMTGISLLSRSLANELKLEENAGSDDAIQVSELADEASDQIRRISRGLMPSDIVRRGLRDALCELARTTTDCCGVECIARVDEGISFADGAVETHLYRIAQEAVNNAVRHAGAGRIEIVMSIENDQVLLAVSDDGVWKRPPPSQVGIGLKTMEYRASVIGGQLWIGAKDQGGTRVVCRLKAEDAFATR
jgi:signal transduction histidine kinase